MADDTDDLIAAYLAKGGTIKTAPAAPAYGLDPERDKQDKKLVHVVAGRSIDGSCWYTGFGWTNDRRDAAKMTRAQAEAVVLSVQDDNKRRELDATIGCLTIVIAGRDWPKHPRKKPVRRNWAAQAAYDEEHGTINGYAPWQYGREE